MICVVALVAALMTLWIPGLVCADLTSPWCEEDESQGEGDPTVTVEVLEGVGHKPGDEGGVDTARPLSYHDLVFLPLVHFLTVARALTESLPGPPG